MNFGKRLASLRNDRGISVHEIAKAIGVPISTYRDWEYGKLIRGEPYVKIADFMGVTLDELLRDEHFENSELLSVLDEARDAILRALKIAKTV